MGELRGRAATAAFLKALSHDVGGRHREGFFQLPWRAAGSERFIGAHAPLTADLGAVAEQVAIRARTCDVWVGVQLLRQLPEQKYDDAGRQTTAKRGGGQITSGLSAVAIDIDLPTPSRKAKMKDGLVLPPDVAAVRQILAGLPEATVTVASGAGVQAWWLLDVWADVDVDEAARVSRGWSVHAHQVAGSLGWHLDTTRDLARVLRLPGTRNHKYAGGPEVRMVAFGPRYSLADIAALIPAAEPETPRETPCGPVGVRAAGSDGDASEVTEAWTAGTDWAVILGPAGWQLCRDNGNGEREWTRPGKERGVSATTHDSPPVMTCYSSASEALLPPDEPLTKLRVFALLYHGGDEGAAWRSFAPAPSVGRLVEFVTAGDVEHVGGRLAWAVRQQLEVGSGDAHADDFLGVLVDTAVGLGLARGDAGMVLVRAGVPALTVAALLRGLPAAVA